MAQLSRLWAGRVYGTNTGNLFIEFDSAEPTKISGTLRFMDSLLGLTIYSVHGTFEESLKLSGQPAHVSEDVESGELTIEAKLTSEGNIRGTWSSSIGTGGTFEVFPHDVDQSKGHTGKAPLVPEQLYTRNIALGSVRLFGGDVKDLIEDIRKDFLTGRPIITFDLRGNRVTRYAEDFLRDAHILGRLDYFKVTIQEPEAYGINRVVVVELDAYGSNEVRVQGVQESWVIGKAEAIASVLRRYQNPLITTYKKFGLNLNQAIFLAMLVIMPSISEWTGRVLFAIGVFALLTAMLWFHARFIPNASIRMGLDRPTIIGRIWPTILSWFAAVSASLVAAWLFYLLTRNAP